MPEVKGRRHTAAEGDISFNDAAQPGDFQFQTLSSKPTDDPCIPASPAEHPSDGWSRLYYICPRTGNPCGGVLIGRTKPGTVAPSWAWNGNLDAPSLTPSINCQKPGCGWHGYLTDGVFKD